MQQNIDKCASIKSKTYKSINIIIYIIIPCYLKKKSPQAAGQNVATFRRQSN